MTKLTGFLQLRRGVLEHVKDGRLSHMDALTLIYIATQADTRTGVWSGSAGALAGELALSPRNARRILERLTNGKYITRFPVPGRHVCYPILVHKFLVTDGEHKGQHLNALDSDSPTDLTYIRSEQESEQICQHTAPQKRIENREERKRQNPAAKPAPPSDPRHKLAVDLCFEAYRAKYGTTPTWGSREGTTLRRFVKEHPSIRAEEIAGRYRNFLYSTERYHAEKHGSLCHLLSNFDVFADGSIHKSTQKGASFGKTRVDPDQRTLENLRAAGLLD